MKVRVDILPPAQRELWDEHAGAVPPGWVLYGGTAVALRLGHRQSVDFDFFSDLPLDEDALRGAVRCLATAQVLHRAPNTLDCSVRFASGDLETRLSEETKRALTLASAAVDPATLRPIPLLSRRLSARAELAERAEGDGGTRAEGNTSAPEPGPGGRRGRGANGSGGRSRGRKDPRGRG